MELEGFAGSVICFLVVFCLGGFESFAISVCKPMIQVIGVLDFRGKTDILNLLPAHLMSSEIQVYSLSKVG